jgi:hypothetical protein
LEDFMVKRSFGMVMASVLIAGCYDTPKKDPYPSDWVAGDFDSGTGAAPVSGYKLPRLDQWECRPRDSTHDIDECKVIPDLFPLPGQDSGVPTGMVLHLKSTLWPATEGDYFTRSEVATFIEPPQDMTDYDSLFLRARLGWQGGGPNLKIQLSCSQVMAAAGGISPNPCVLQLPDMCRSSPCDWRSAGLSLRFGAFNPPGELTLNGGAVDARECLAHVDAIKITVDSNSSTSDAGGDAQVGFDLYVAEVKFIPKARKR